MNWLDRGTCGGFIKSGLAISLLALILFACEEPNEIGNELIPGRDTVGVFAVEIPVSTGVYKQDSLVTRDRLLFGNYNDPEFGSMYAESYVGIIPTSLRQIPNAATGVFDSITLKLRVDYMYGTNVYSPKDIKIYQLEELIKPYERVPREGKEDSIVYYEFYTHDRHSYQRLLADTSLNLNNLSPFKEDSVFFTITLDPQFGQEIFNYAIAFPDTFANFDSANRLLKGLALVPGSNNNAIYGIDVSSTSSNVYNSIVTLHYHTSTDTLEYTFGLNQPRYNYIKSDRNGTVLANMVEDEPFYPDDNKLYAQAGTGIIGFIDVGAISQLKESAEKFVVNNATLYIDVDNNNFYDYLKPPPSLILYAVDSLGRPVYGSIGDYYSLNKNLGGQVDLQSRIGRHQADLIPGKNRYMLDLTLFLQELTMGKHEFEHIALYPSLSFEFDNVNKKSYLLSGSRINRLIVSPENIRLKVYYTTL